MNRHLTGMFAATAILASSTFSVAVAQEARREADVQDPPNYLLLKKVEGAILKTKEGLTIGTIDDLVVDVKARKIAFAVVSTGGFLGVGDRLAALPYDLVAWRMEKGEAAPFAEITKQNVQMAPPYEHKRLLEHLADEQWRDETKAAFGTYPKDAVIEAPKTAKPNGASDERLAAAADADAKVAVPRFRRASELAGVRVVASPKDASGDEANGAEKKDGLAKLAIVGDVDAFVVRRKSGAIVAAIVSRGGIVGAGETKFVVPFAALEATRAPNEFLVNKSVEAMENAPRVEKPPIERLENKEYRARLEEFYGVDLD